MGVQVGITLPLMEPGLDRDVLHRWATRLDEGPFATLACGERIAYRNFELLTSLSACAAWTTRIRIATAVFITPLHNPVLLAKQLATLDVLSDGRLIAGLGIGNRDEDFRALGCDPARMNAAELARLAKVMKDVWRGERQPADAHHPVGPNPVQTGGPPLRAGAIGPKAIRAAAGWADAVTGWSMSGGIEEMEKQFELTRAAWGEAGRAAPELITSFWLGLGPNARDQVTDHIRRYFDYMEPPMLESFASGAGFAGSAADLRALLRRIEDAGGHEAILCPTTVDPDEVYRIADAIG